MRLRALTSCALALAVAFTVACNNDSTSPSDPPGPPIDTKLTCNNPDGSASECNLDLPAGKGFDIVIQSTSCFATDNKLHLLSPVDSLLTSNGCSLKGGEGWSFGPFQNASTVSLMVTSATLAYPPQLVVSGSYPSWTVTFEDGGDSDMNDIVLKVTATP